MTEFAVVYPIVEYVDLNVSSSDTLRGTASGGGHYSKDVTRRISAQPNEGYRFKEWSDGDRTLIRDIYLLHDTSLTAYFTKIYRVDVRANDAELGYVTGGGEYDEEDEVEIVATASHGNSFVSWDDGVTDNPRRATASSGSSSAVSPPPLVCGRNGWKIVPLFWNVNCRKFSNWERYYRYLSAPQAKR